MFEANDGEITIPSHPQRVVTTGYAVPVLVETDTKLVGISSWLRGDTMMSPRDKATYDRPEKVAGELATETNDEAIAKVEPDLIVIGVPKPVLADRRRTARTDRPGRRHRAVSAVRMARAVPPPGRRRGHDPAPRCRPARGRRRRPRTCVAGRLTAGASSTPAGRRRGPR